MAWVLRDPACRRAAAEADADIAVAADQSLEYGDMLLLLHASPDQRRTFGGQIAHLHAALAEHRDRIRIMRVLRLATQVDGFAGSAEHQFHPAVALALVRVGEVDADHVARQFVHAPR
jgi:hypothetical protein